MSRATDRAGEERGYALPELLVATLIGLIVAAAAMTLVTTLIKGQPQVSERAGKIQQGRVMLERLTRELRQGNEITNTSAAGLRVLTFTDGGECGGTPGTTTNCWVTYACGATSCTRTPDGGNAEVVVRGISGPGVFCYSPWNGESACAATSASAPTYVSLRLVFPNDDGEESVTLDDGIGLRNAA